MEFFTAEKTIVFGIILIISSYFIYRLVKFLKIKIDEKFFYGAIPWLILSVFVRVYEDVGIYPESFWTTTPGIELLFVLLIIPALFFSVWIERKKGIAYWKTFAVIGAVPIFFHLPYIEIVELRGAALIAISFAIVVGIIGAIRKVIKFDNLTMLAISAHMLDAAATFVSLTFFKYNEQHIVPNFFINIAGGAWIMFPLKLAVIIPVIYVINKYSEDKDLRNLLLIVIIILGLAPGLRDAFRLFMGV